MESSSGSNVFQDLLAEEYKKRPKDIDVVAQKQENFNALIFRARSELRSKRYSEAKKSYLNIIEFLENDPYPDELNISPEVYYSIKCCFCYSCLRDKNIDIKCNKVMIKLLKELSEKYNHKLYPKYLQVLYNFNKNDWISTLGWCNSVQSHEADLEDQYMSIDVTQLVLPIGSRIIAEVQMFEEHAFLNFWESIVKYRLTKFKNDKYQFFLKEIYIIRKLLMTPFSNASLGQIFSTDVIPLWCSSNDDMLNFIPNDKNPTIQCGNCLMAKIKAGTEKSIQRSNIDLEKFLMKLVEAYTKIYECDFIDSIEDRVLSKFDELEDLLTRGNTMKKIMEVEKKDMKVMGTQTDKVKTGNKCIQTETIKMRNVEVQATFDSQVTNTLLDIKNKLLNTQEKKEDTITKLNKRVCELTDKLGKETNKRMVAEGDYEKKINKQEIELKKLREQLEECSKLRKQESEKNISLQKLLVEQVTDQYNVQKNIYKAFEKKANFMVMYLKEILSVLTSSSIPSESVALQNIEIWESHLNKIKADLDDLNAFYKKVRVDMISLNKFDFTWPEIPDFPRDEDNIVFVSFKTTIKNIVQIEENLVKQLVTNVPPPEQQCPQTMQSPSYFLTPQYPIQNQTTSFIMGPALAFPSLPPLMPVATNPPQQYPTFSREHQPKHKQRTTDHKPWQNINIRSGKSNECSPRPTERDVKAVEVVDNCKTNRKKVKTSGGCEKEDKKYQEHEKMLFHYISENCPGSTEDDVTVALLQVVDDNKGTLSKVPKEKILEDVKIILRMKKQSTWVTPKSPHVDWKNDESDPNCSICFEKFSLKEIYTLPCHHKYHKECIKKWLKKSSVCPICRIHSVIAEEYPPLH